LLADFVINLLAATRSPSCTIGLTPALLPITCTARIHVAILPFKTLATLSPLQFVRTKQPNDLSNN
jgi:hypothetical protein